MDNEVLELKQDYNKYILRHCKAEVFFDDCKIPISQKEKTLPEYQKILYHLNRILNELEERSVKYSLEEVLGGFNLEEGEND